MRFFAFTLCVLAAAFPMSALAQDLPPGPGGDLFARTCQSCHGLKVATSKVHDLEEWRSVVAKMILNGADITDMQAEQISYYLATNFGTGPVPEPAPAAAPVPDSSAVAPTGPAAVAPQPGPLQPDVPPAP